MNRIEKLNDNTQLSIVNIQDFITNTVSKHISVNYAVELSMPIHWEMVKNDCFHSDEYIKINSFKSLKRQYEWMSGRFAVKSVLQNALPYDVPLKNIVVDTLPKGAPFLPNWPDYQISISHSNEFAVAAISKNTDPIGFDLEKIEIRNLSNLLKAGFSKREQSLLSPDNYMEIYKNWTIKEAYLKLIKTGFHEPLANVEIIENQLFHKKIPITNKKIVTKLLTNNYIYTYIQ